MHISNGINKPCLVGYHRITFFHSLFAELEESKRNRPKKQNFIQCLWKKHHKIQCTMTNKTKCRTVTKEKKPRENISVKMRWKWLSWRILPLEAINPLTIRNSTRANTFSFVFFIMCKRVQTHWIEKKKHFFKYKFRLKILFKSVRVNVSPFYFTFKNVFLFFVKIIVIIAIVAVVVIMLVIITCVSDGNIMNIRLFFMPCHYHK